MPPLLDTFARANEEGTKDIRAQALSNINKIIRVIRFNSS